LLAITPDLVASVDANTGVIQYINRAGREMVGLTCEDDLSDCDFVAIVPESAHRFLREAILPCAARDGVWTGECALRHRDGHEIPVRMVMLAHKSPSGEVERFSTISRDITDRKRAEQALWERETLLLQAQRIAHMGSWSVDLRTMSVAWTDNTYELCGVSPESFVPSVEALPDLVHPDDRAAVQKYIQASIAGENSGPLEFRVPLPDGGIRVLCGQGELFYDHTGRPVRMIGTLQDITERKRAEQSLRISQFSIDRAGCPIFWVGADAKLVYVNDAACRMLGYSQEELTSKTICDIDPLFATPDRFTAGWEALPREGSLTFETKQVTKDGRVLDVEVTSNFVQFEGRELNCAMLRDVTSRKRGEESVRKSEERNRTILRTAMDGFWRLDMQGHVLEVNEAFCRMSGYSERELLTMNVFDLEAIETPVETAAHIQKIATRGADRFESRHHRKDGTTYSIEVSVQHSPLEGGQMFAFLRDISERKQAESQAGELRERLSHAQRLGTLGEIASGLAHELNQPLTSIHMDANTALSLCKSLESPGLHRCLRRLSEQSFRAGEIIRHMRSLIRRESSFRTLDDINGLINEVLRLLGDYLTENSVTVELDLAERLPPIEVDRIQIQQVLVNLIRNAGEAMAQNLDEVRVLSLRTENIDKDIRVSVGDSGCGIEGDIVPKLFFPFRSTKPAGLGLGLSICRTLVEAHNGHIEMHPNPDRGTTFQFTVPVVQ
jgi:two-component system sensor kinase FixL